SEIVARSPIRPVQPVIERGWEVTALRLAAPLTLVDLAPSAKVHVRADRDGVMANALGVAFGRAARDDTGALVIGSGPGEWLVLGPLGSQHEVRSRLRSMATEGAELVSVIDLTHGRALMRLTGSRAPDVLAKVCGIDFGDAATPNGTALRSSVAKLVTDVVRDDQGSDGQGSDGRLVRSYLLHCERSSGQYLFDAMLDAGAEFEICVGGFPSPQA
ncbi:MAG: sarcosine oxidase subunit gamma, partial [Trebonia sp.]